MIAFPHRFWTPEKHPEYYKAGLVSEIFDFFSTHDQSEYKLSDISAQSGIPSSVLCRWRKNFEKDHSYRPRRNFGKHKKMLTAAQEAEVANLIAMQYIIR